MFDPASEPMVMLVVGSVLLGIYNYVLQVMALTGAVLIYFLCWRLLGLVTSIFSYRPEFHEHVWFVQEKQCHLNWAGSAGFM
jgi:hypothetical protein